MTTRAQIDVSQQLTAVEARRQLTFVLENGAFDIPRSGHVRDRMKERDISPAQVITVAERGSIAEPGEWENGTWRYRLWRGELGIVVMFVAADKARVCTVLETEPRRRRRQRKATR